MLMKYMYDGYNGDIDNGNNDMIVTMMVMMIIIMIMIW